MTKIEYVTSNDKAFWYSLDKHLPEKEFENKVASKQGYVIFADDRPVGLLRYNLFWDNTPFCTLLFIDWQEQHKGYGKQLLKHWEEDMKAQGYGMVLTSTQVDETAQRFYRKNGYKDCGSLVMNIPGYEQPMEMFLSKGLLNMNMKLRPFKPEDSQIICSWVKDEKTLFQWSADRIGKFPLMGNELNENYAERKAGLDFFPLTAVDEKENVIGHLFVLIPDENVKTTVRFGFVIVSPEIRGKGYGKKMLELAIEYAKKELKATKATLGVFANNPKAKVCYEAVGFKPFSKRIMKILGSDWECIDMELILQ